MWMHALTFILNLHVAITLNNNYSISHIYNRHITYIPATIYSRLSCKLPWGYCVTFTGVQVCVCMLHTCHIMHPPPRGCRVSGVGAPCSRWGIPGPPPPLLVPESLAGPRGRAQLITGVPGHGCGRGRTPQSWGALSWGWGSRGLDRAPRSGMGSHTRLGRTLLPHGAPKPRAAGARPLRQRGLGEGNGGESRGRGRGGGGGREGGGAVRARRAWAGGGVR